MTITQADRDRTVINETTQALIKQLGRDIGKIGDFNAEIVIMEGVAAGFIAFNAIRYNKQPDEIVEAFCQGLRERVDRIIYRTKQ